LKLDKVKNFLSSPLLTNSLALLWLIWTIFFTIFKEGFVKVKPISIFIAELTNTKVPMGTLFYLILAIFIVVLIKRKIRNLSLNSKEKFIISILNERELGFRILFKAYKAKFEKETRVISNCVSTVRQLKKKGLVESQAYGGRINGITDELWRLTNKGKKQYEKLDGIKEEAEQILRQALSEGSQGGDKPKRLEPHDEVMFILNEFANQRDKKLHKDILRRKYFAAFKNKTEADFNIIWSRLEREGLICIFGYDVCHSITGEGLDYLGRNRTSK
jgi:hypothetical protein